jgi:hypothetical protein
MIVQISYRKTFAVCAETYWRELWLNLAYQERLFCEALGFRSMEVLENSGDYERGLKRRLRLVKPVDGPAAVIKVLGSVMTLEEHSEFDPAAQRWSYRVIPGRMADRLEVHGSLQLQRRPGGVEQLSADTLTCRMFGLGGLMEPFMARSTERGHADRAAFTQRYIAERQLR